MDLIIDTSHLVTAERLRHSVVEILQQIERIWGQTGAGISAITVFELAHGIARAKTEMQREGRTHFLQDIRRALIVNPLTDEITERAGLIAGEQAQQGTILPLADLLIGATALHHGCDVITENIRDFRECRGCQ